LRQGAAWFLAMVLCVRVHAGAAASEFTVRWLAESADAGRAFVEVSGISATALNKLRKADWKTEQWQRLLTVRVEQGDLIADIGLPPMLGAYQVTANTLRFEPQYPPDAGVAYRATFQPGELPSAKKPGGLSISAVFKRAVSLGTPTTVVSQVYPSGGTVPENLLKFYVHFSAPMSGGHIYEHIHLLDDAGKPVELPFLEIDEELWNPEMTRLTLFIDPGRIKREVKPLEDIGPALVLGKQHTLVIDSAWKDGVGRPLKAEFRKAFLVGPADREPPDPSRWKIAPPKSGGRNPLTVVFPDPMDHALSQRMIQVGTRSGDRINGRIELGDEERRWTFVPAEAWRAGGFTLNVQTTIEDLAGNNIGKAFEVDVFDGVQRRLTNNVVTIPFEVR